MKYEFSSDFFCEFENKQKKPEDLTTCYYVLSIEQAENINNSVSFYGISAKLEKIH